MYTSGTWNEYLCDRGRRRKKYSKVKLETSDLKNVNIQKWGDVRWLNN